MKEMAPELRGLRAARCVFFRGAAEEPGGLRGGNDSAAPERRTDAFARACGGREEASEWKLP